MITPALHEQYAGARASPTIPKIEAILIIEPPPVFNISWIAYLLHKNTPLKLIETILSNVSVGQSAKKPPSPTPALATIISNLPNTWTVWLTKAFTSSSFLTSIFINLTLGLFNPCKTSAPFSA